MIQARGIHLDCGGREYACALTLTFGGMLWYPTSVEDGAGVTRGCMPGIGA